jgi:hypothetical protein
MLGIINLSLSFAAFTNEASKAEVKKAKPYLFPIWKNGALIILAKQI